MCLILNIQLAPGIPASQKRPQFFTRPEWGFHWYKNLTYSKDTSVNPFFYGTYLGPTAPSEPVQRSAAQAVQCDALSALTTLPYSFWTGMHTFRLEWQPGDNGYLHWYIDGVFKYGVEQEGLDIMKTKIPNEPSSIIINTAISSTWGFPSTPPGCNTYDCKTLSGQCGFYPGFCKSLPAKFLVDHIRVYQHMNDSRQTVGCDPKGYPTKEFIAGHLYRYKSAVDVLPLQPIAIGGAKCTTNTDCAGVFGSGQCELSSFKCVCKSGWVGPRCLVCVITAATFE